MYRKYAKNDKSAQRPPISQQKMILSTHCSPPLCSFRVSEDSTPLLLNQYDGARPDCECMVLRQQNEGESGEAVTHGEDR